MNFRESKGDFISGFGQTKGMGCVLIPKIYSCS